MKNMFNISLVQLTPLVSLFAVAFEDDGILIEGTILLVCKLLLRFVEERGDQMKSCLIY